MTDYAPDTDWPASEYEPREIDGGGGSEPDTSEFPRVRDAVWGAYLKHIGVPEPDGD